MTLSTDPDQRLELVSDHYSDGPRILKRKGQEPTDQF
jgi:hypothetical protein